MKYYLILGLSVCLSLMSFSAQAQSGLEQRIQKILADQALDRSEYLELQALNAQNLSTEEQEIQQELLGFLSRYAHRRKLNFRHQLSSGRTVAYDFIFVRSYSENDLIEGQNPIQVLSQISQHDILPDTQKSNERCGAASLLAAHYLLYGNWEKAFQNLGQSKTTLLNYANMHRTQETLFRRVKKRRDKIGLVTQFSYSTRPDGSIYNIRAGGEIQDAANLLDLSNTSVLGPDVRRFFEREDIIKNIWQQNPSTVFLVGVHNDSHNRISPPNDAQPQNHYVLIFQEAGRFYLYNSGVWDNAKGSAIKRLRPEEVQDWLHDTRGSINALKRL